MPDEVIGSAVVEIKADLAKLRKDFDTAQRQTTRTTRQLSQRFEGVKATVGKLRKAVGILGAAIAAVAGGSALQRLTRESIKFADGIGKTAAKLGVTTDELQEFRFAADQASVPIQTLDMGLQRFLRRAAEARQGTGEAKDAIEQLGVAFQDADGRSRSGGELFADALRRLGELQDEGERLRLAFKLFDSEGVALVNLARGFDEAREQARELGIVLDRDTIANAERLESQLNAVAAATKRDLTQSLAQLAPLLVSTAQGLAAVARSVSLIVSRLDGFGNRSRFQVQQLLDANLEEQQQLTDEIARLEEEGEGTFGFITRPLSNARANLRKLRQDAQIFRLELKQLTDETKDDEGDGGLGPGLGITPEQVRNFRKLQQQLETDLLKSSENRRALAEREFLERIELIEREGEAAKAVGLDVAQARADAQRALSEELRLIAEDELEVARQQREEAEKFTESITRELNAARGDLASNAQAEHEERLRRLDELEAKGADVDQARLDSAQLLAEELRQIEEDQIEGIENIRDAFEDLGEFTRDTFARTFADVLLNGGNVFRALGDLFIREVVNRAVAALVGSLFSGALGGGLQLLGGLAGGGGGTAAGLGATDLPAPVAPGLQLAKTDQVLQADALSVPPVVGGTVNVNVQKASGVEVDVEERQGTDGTVDIELMVRRTVARDIQTGGPVSKSLGTVFGLGRRGRG